MNLGFVVVERSFFAATLENLNPASSPTVPNDPLVNHSWHNFTYIAALVLVIILVVIVGVVSRSIEHTIASALVASLLLIGFFLLVGH